ncbi:MAG: MMPL family transporter [Acidobacteriota bacterium]
MPTTETPPCADSTLQSSPWARWVVARWKLLLVLGFLALLAAGLRLAGASFDTDLVRLLPQDNRAVADYLEGQRLFAAESVILLLTRDGAAVEASEAQRLLDLARDEEITDGTLTAVDALPFPAPEIDDVAPYAIQLADPEQREQLVERLQTSSIESSASRLRRRLALPLTSDGRELLRRDPLGLLELLPKDLLPSAPPSDGGWQVRDGLLSSADGQAVALFARSAEGGQDESGYQRLLEGLETLEQRFFSDSPEASAAGYALRFTGAPVINGHEARLLRGETRDSFLLSMVLVVALFAWAFRRPLAALWLTLPLGGAVLTALALGDVLFGSLSLLTASVAALMVGLGIDFGIHIYTRAQDRCRDGLSSDDALASALSEVSGANFAAALTTGGAFATLALSSIPGLRQMGWLTAISLILCFVFMTTVFPATLHGRGALRAPSGSPVPASRLARWLRPWLRTVARHPKITVLGLALVTAGALPWISQLQFGGTDFTRRAAVNQALATQQNMVERFGTHFRSGLVLLRGEPEAVAEAARLAGHAARQLASAPGAGTAAPSTAQEPSSDPSATGPVLLAHVSPLSALPSPAAQQANLDAARSAGQDVPAELSTALTQRGLAPRGFQPGIDSLTTALTSGRPLRFQELLEHPHWRQILDPFVAPLEDGEVVYALYILPTDSTWSAETLQRLEAAFRNSVEGSEVRLSLVTPRGLSHALRGATQREITPLALSALAAVLLILSVHLRHPGWTILATLPLLLATTWLLGAAGALGLRLSVENLAALPMVLGIGIDDALHVIHHVRRHPERSSLLCILESGKAVVLTTITTLLAFASLIFAGHPTLYTLGVLTGLGVGFCMITTLTVIPAAAGLMPSRLTPPEPRGTDEHDLPA